MLSSSSMTILVVYAKLIVCSLSEDVKAIKATVLRISCFEDKLLSGCYDAFNNLKTGQYVDVECLPLSGFTW